MAIVKTVLSLYCRRSWLSGGRAPTRPSLRKGGMLMSDYELLMIILTMGLVICAILNLTHKK